MAACLGREFDAELLFALVRKDVDGAIAVQQLIQRCVLEESAGGRFRFVHDKLREATYAVIPPEQRRELHRRAAVMLEGWPGDAPRSYPSQVGGDAPPRTLGAAPRRSAVGAR